MKLTEQLKSGFAHFSEWFKYDVSLIKSLEFWLLITYIPIKTARGLGL